MALQSEVSPTIVGESPNKDTQIDGEKSDENHSSQSTDEDADLEDGEIQESEEEEEKDFSNVSLKEALDKSCLQNIEQLVNQAKNAKVVASPDRSKSIPPPRKSKRMADNYMDHDRTEPASDQEKGGWFPSSPKFKQKYSDKPIDYRMELAAYRGTPPSSPERRRERDEKKKKRSSKKSKKSKKTIRRKDIKGHRVANFKREAAKGKVCKFFKEGKCVKGSDCYFSHTVPSFKKKDLCKFYLNGHCNKGKDCMYMHSEFPCKFYHTGSECYAKSDCRFSHAPLTDEMKKVLADYLRNCHGDDLRHNNRNDDRDNNTRDHNSERDRDRDRDRHKRPPSRSPSPSKPPPPKRTCLLGSPPRHIREAEETRRWQEEMRMLQQQNHPSFEIHLSPGRDDMATAEFQKPNFYQETLLNTPSPKKRPPLNLDPPFRHDNDYDEGSPSKVYVYDEDDFIEIDMSTVKPEPQEEYHHWDDVQNVAHPVENHAKPFIENPNRELDFTNDVKFDETTQFSEMESSTDYPPAPSPHSPPIEDYSDHPKHNTDDNKQHPDDSTPRQAPANPIVVPTHLPRKQQELFMRVLQHQRLNQANVGGDSPEGNESGEPQIKKELENEPEEKFEMGIKESEWYTSEEEDDDDEDDNDGQLLKKLQQAPPKPQPAEPKPAPKVDLLAIFNTIQQKTKEKNKGLSEIQQKHSSFWQNILGGVTASKVSPPTTVPSTTTPSELPKRRTLLPDPVTIKTEPTTPAEPPVVKDPRLKNRDPRKLAREPKPEISIPKHTSIPELGSPPIKPTAASEQSKESIPYRLRGITAKPLNYTPYLTASQSNPSLLKDPRLRKHLQSTDPVNGTEKDHDIVKLPAVPPKNAPPIPELLLKYEKPVAAINIFESSSSSKPAEKPDAKPSINVPVAVTYDPSDMKGRVPIPVIPLLDSKLSISVSVDSKSKAPVSVPYDPVISKSPAVIPTPVTYEPVDSKSRAPVPVAASYDPENLKFSSKVPVTAPYNPDNSKFSSPVHVTASYDPDNSKFISKIPVTASYDPDNSKFSSPVNVTASYDSKNSKFSSPDPVVKSSKPVEKKSSAPISKRRESGGSKKRAAKTSATDPRAKRRDSHTSTSGSDTPPHLTIVDSGTTPPQQEFKSAPVLENEIVELDEKKKVSPVSDKSPTSPPLIEEEEEDILASIKKEIESFKPTSIKKEIESDSIKPTTTKKVIESDSIKPTSTKKVIELDLIKPTNTKKVIESDLIKPTSIKKETESDSTSIKKETESDSIKLTSVKKEIESDSDSNQDPPPPTSKASHKRSISPPIVEQFMTVIKKEVPQDNSGDSKPVVPPLIIKKVKPVPTPASHLPKAIADPRMAKLHNPRRPRLAASNTSPRRTSERRKAAIEAEAAIEATSESMRDKSPKASRLRDLGEEKPKPKAKDEPKSPKKKDSPEEKPKAVKSIPKKRRLSDKSDEKKKTVHRNRKSSMDYASPLNSCDATTESSSYSRYNQRPKRGVTSAPATMTGKDSPTTSVPSDSSSIPEFALSDSSNLECDNSNDVNLKDRFKTIDPTASPFC